MNVKKTYEYFEENGIVAVRADKGVQKTSKQIDNLLMSLGNKTKAIPFYAIYPPGGGDPVVLEGLITSAKVIEVFEKFSREGQESTDPGSKPIETSTKKSGEKKVAVRN